jgi:hypothetical protein
MNEKIPEFVVGLGTLALINSGIAQGKNRSGLNWFLLSIILGPLATLTIVLLPKLPNEPVNPERKSFNLEDHRQQCPPLPNQPVETTAAPLPFSSFATSAYSLLNHVLVHSRLT